MNTTEFGKRVLYIREELLAMNQSELATKIDTTQVLLSRVERGIGGNINVVFNLINFLNKKGFNGHMLFREPFDINALKKETFVGSKKNFAKLIAELKNSADHDSAKLGILLDAFK